MKAKKWTYGTIGTVSHATMRSQDLLPAFVDELRYLGHRDTKLTIIERRVQSALNGKYGEEDTYFENEESSWDLDDLFDMLDSHALPYMYFGAHAGDGSDYGFWINSDALEDWVNDGELLKVEDLNDIPVNHTGEVLEVNERGNMTLYAYSRGKSKEIWSVV